VRVPGLRFRPGEAVISVGSELDLSAVPRRHVEPGVELTGARYRPLGVLDQERTASAELISVGLHDA
jgi:hypothetical protein